MREGGYNPAVGLKFTLYRQREDRRVTTPPNDSSQKEERNKDRKMGGDRVQGGRSGRCKSWPPLSGLTILMWTPPRPLLNCAKLIWRSRHIFYANTTVLSTQGACREAGGGLMGLDALQGGKMRMGWDGWGREMGWVRCVRPQQHPAETFTPCSGAVTLYSHKCCVHWGGKSRSAGVV